MSSQNTPRQSRIVRLGRSGAGPAITYDMDDRVGRGQFGVVYKGRVAGSNEIVAVKVFHDPLTRVGSSGSGGGTQSVHAMQGSNMPDNAPPCTGENTTTTTTTAAAAGGGGGGAAGGGGGGGGGSHESKQVPVYPSEVDILNRLKKFNCPNILRVHSMYKQRDSSKRHNEQFRGIQYVIASEFCAGGDLKQLIHSRGSLPFPITRSFIYQLANALWLFKANKIIHRDIKPANLLLSDTNLEEAVLTVADLGMAKRAVSHRGEHGGSSNSSGATAIAAGESVGGVGLQHVGAVGPSTSVVMPLGSGSAAAAERFEDTEYNLFQSELGTPMYMSPERLMGKSYGYDADVYSAGMVLFEMLTGNPVRARDRTQLLVAVPNAIEELKHRHQAEGIPLWLDLLEGMTASDPARRLSVERVLRHRWFSEEEGPPLPPLTIPLPELLPAAAAVVVVTTATTSAVDAPSSPPVEAQEDGDSTSDKEKEVEGGEGQEQRTIPSFFSHPTTTTTTTAPAAAAAHTVATIDIAIDEGVAMACQRDAAVPPLESCTEEKEREEEGRVSEEQLVVATEAPEKGIDRSVSHHSVSVAEEKKKTEQHAERDHTDTNNASSSAFGSDNIDRASERWSVIMVAEVTTLVITRNQRTTDPQAAGDGTRCSCLASSTHTALLSHRPLHASEQEPLPPNCNLRILTYATRAYVSSIVAYLAHEHRHQRWRESIIPLLCLAEQLYHAGYAQFVTELQASPWEEGTAAAQLKRVWQSQLAALQALKKDNATYTPHAQNNRSSSHDCSALAPADRAEDSHVDGAAWSSTADSRYFASAELLFNTAMDALKADALAELAVLYAAPETTIGREVSFPSGYDFNVKTSNTHSHSQGEAEDPWRRWSLALDTHGNAAATTCSSRATALLRVLLQQVVLTEGEVGLLPLSRCTSRLGLDELAGSAGSGEQQRVDIGCVFVLHVPLLPLLAAQDVAKVKKVLAYAVQRVQAQERQQQQQRLRERQQQLRQPRSLQFKPELETFL